MLFLLLFISAVCSLKIGNETVEAWYNSYGEKPDTAFVAEAIISEEISFDSCTAFREVQKKENITSVKVGGSNSLFTNREKFLFSLSQGREIKTSNITAERIC